MTCLVDIVWTNNEMWKMLPMMGVRISVWNLATFRNDVKPNVLDTISLPWIFDIYFPLSIQWKSLHSHANIYFSVTRLLVSMIISFKLLSLFIVLHSRLKIRYTDTELLFHRCTNIFSCFICWKMLLILQLKHRMEFYISLFSHEFCVSNEK